MAEVARNKQKGLNNQDPRVKQLKYITNLSDISVCNTNLPLGLNGKEIGEKHKRIVTNKGQAKI